MQRVSFEDLPQVTEELVLLGFSGADIGDILGGNCLRVARQVWRE
jgi:microsomal dipeptidase-like Zn-dependent dipeptidase